ncbi:MAG: DNA-directed DNA polymerase [Candidatus Nanohalobium sp.]
MKRNVQVIDADYQVSEEEVTVRCFAKSKDGENVLFYDREFLPYVYVVPEEGEDPDELKQLILEEEWNEEGEPLPVKKVEALKLEDLKKEKKVLKVYSSIPAKIPKLKNKFWDLEEVKECREFDIPFYRRYLVDKGIRPASWIEVQGQELTEKDSFNTVIEADKVRVDEENPVEKNSPDETREPGGFKWKRAAFDLEVYQERIIMASIYGKDIRKVLTTEDIEREFVETVESEKQLIERIVDIVQEEDIDILTGYNTDEFDFDILRSRSNKYNITLSMGRDGERMKFNQRGRFKGARLKGRMHLDLYPFIEHVISPGLDSETLDLDSVAEELLGENKDEMSWEEMKQAWKKREDLEEFADYALKDSELAFKLADELVPQILELSRITGLIPFDTCRLTYGQLTENYLIREAHERGMMARNRPSQQSRRKRRREGAYSGGFVYTPEAGLYENIALLDFKSLYPTVMVSHNISPDTLDLDNCDNRFQLEEFEYDFCQDEQGFFPELVEKLVRDRSNLKEKMEKVDKDSKKFQKLDNRQKAEKILSNSFYGYLGYNSARWYSRECAEAITYLGRQHIQDTIEKAEENGYEVVYGDTDSVFIRKEGIRDDIDIFLEEINRDLPSFMQLEFEGFFTRGFFTSTDSGEGAKKKYALLSEDGGMKITGFEQVRRDWSPIAKKTQKRVLRKVLENDVEKAAEIVQETIEDLKNGKIPVEELKIYTTLTKKPEKYDSTAPHVEAAKKAIGRGDEIPPETTISYVITRGAGNISSRAELVKYAEDYDPDYYIDNQVIPVALRVLKVFGYTEGQLKGKGKQSGLGRFGS